MFALKPLKVAVAVEPVKIPPPGLTVTVHVPEGNPVNSTLAVATKQVGWLTVPITGAEGLAGCALMLTVAEGDEVHPAALVTLKV